MFWQLFTLACGSAGSETPSTSALSPSRHEVHAVVAAPKSPTMQPSAGVAFEARPHCPRVLWADFEPDQPPYGTLTLHADRAFSELQVALPQGRSASAKGRPTQNPRAPQGSQDFAIACQDCTLLLAFEHQSFPLACEGPGMALTLAAGKLIPWQED